jgi:hypothetical protein
VTAAQAAAMLAANAPHALIWLIFCKASMKVSMLLGTSTRDAQHHRTAASAVAIMPMPPMVVAKVWFITATPLVTPNVAKDISSWAYDYAASRVDVTDNRARGVACYDARYTFVEKLQTVSTKFRLQQQSCDFPANFMRHYYDIWSLLQRKDVQAFVGTQEYKAHKAKRFRQGDNPDVTENQAFILSDPNTRDEYEKAYNATPALYYGKKPSFDEVLKTIARWGSKL